MLVASALRRDNLFLSVRFTGELRSEWTSLPPSFSQLVPPRAENGAACQLSCDTRECTDIRYVNVHGVACQRDKALPGSLAFASCGRKTGKRTERHGGSRGCSSELPSPRVLVVSVAALSAADTKCFPLSLKHTRPLVSPQPFLGDGRRRPHRRRSPTAALATVTSLPSEKSVDCSPGQMRLRGISVMALGCQARRRVPSR